MIFNRPKPEDVFTPRSAKVNSEMYVARLSLEKALKTALRGSLHIIIHGESGTGKSWLYKKTFRDAGVPFIVANLANASRLGSISKELENLVARKESAVKTAYQEVKSAEVNAVVAKGTLSHTGQYKIGQMEPFEACLSYLRGREKDPSGSCIRQFRGGLYRSACKELANLIILCDDERYEKYKVKILIVGVPSGIKEYFYKTPHHETVANRLTELPEVSRLEKEECDLLVKRGLTDKLKYSVPELNEVLHHVAWISDRVPQVVHEYCLELAFLCEELHTVTSDQISAADDAWLSKSQYYAYSVVESHMNERDTKAGRRNQTIYSLSLCEGEQFKSPDVEEIVRKEFPDSTNNTALNIPQILSQLSRGERPLVRRSPKGEALPFSDPRYRMVLRAMLNKTADERVEKRPISRH